MATAGAFTANPGAGGDTFAADLVASEKVPYSKLDIGAVGASSPVTAANPLPVTASALPLPTGAATAAAQTTGNASLASIDTKLTSPIGTRVSAYNYPISTANSSTAQLAAGASFTGTIETAQDQPSISILLTSDQPTTLTLRQFIDIAGTFAAPDIVFYVRAGESFSRSLPINGNFLRVIAQNTGASLTTTFNLNVAFGALGDADSSGVQPVTELPLVLNGASAQTAVVNNILLPASGAAGLGVSGYRSASVQVVSTATGGTFIFEQSNDNVNWVALPVFNAALVTGVPITAAITPTASQIIYTFPLRGNFVRLRIATLLTGGSIQAFSRISSDPWTPTVALVASNTAANLNATVSGTVGVTGYPTAAASADALANPTVTKVDATSLVFNGTTWDRQRGMSTALTTGDTGAKVATGNGATITNVGNKGVQILVNMGTVTGTTPTAVLKVQGSTDAGTSWYDIPGATTASLTATGLYGITIYPGIAVTAGVATTGTTATASMPIPRTWRMVWTIGGTTPSFTITAIQYIYLPN